MVTATRFSVAVGLTAVILAAAVAGCPIGPNQKECVDACKTLSNCGLLPSPLGATTDESSDAEENCEARCRLSDDRVGSEVRDCTSKPMEEQPSPCSVGCQELADCLERAFPDEGILGHGTAEVCAVGKAGLADCNNGFDQDSPTNDGGWCEREKITAGRAFVMDRSRYQQTDDTACDQLIDRRIPFRDLTPGNVRAGFEVWGAVTSEDGGAPEPFCRVYTVAETCVRAGAPTVAQVIVTQAGSDCESTLEMCHNGLDDDHNGLADCLDPKCDCATSGSSDEGGVDGGTLNDAAPDQEGTDAR